MVVNKIEQNFTKQMRWEYMIFIMLKMVKTYFHVLIRSCFLHCWSLYHCAQNLLKILFSSETSKECSFVSFIFQKDFLKWESSIWIERMTFVSFRDAWLRWWYCNCTYSEIQSSIQYYVQIIQITGCFSNYLYRMILPITITYCVFLCSYSLCLQIWHLSRR